MAGRHFFEEARFFFPLMKKSAIINYQKIVREYRD